MIINQPLRGLNFIPMKQVTVNRINVTYKGEPTELFEIFVNGEFYCSKVGEDKMVQTLNELM